MDYEKPGPTPHLQEAIFYDCVTNTDQLRGLVEDAYRTEYCDLSQEEIPAAELNSKRKEIREREKQELEPLNSKEEQLIKELPEDLRLGAQLFISILDAVRQAEASIRNGEPRPISDFTERSFVPNKLTFATVLLAARATGYAQTLKVASGYAIATTWMSVDDVEGSYWEAVPKQLGPAAGPHNSSSG